MTSTKLKKGVLPPTTFIEPDGTGLGNMHLMFIFNPPSYAGDKVV
jgi:hypothetical protein